MKKIIIFLFSLFITVNSFSQTKAEEENYQYVKNFYAKLKAIKLDPSGDLFWKYTYADTNLINLTKLSAVFEKEGLKTMDLGPSKTRKGEYDITVYEKKTYKNPKVLNERVNYLNSVAKIYKLLYSDATISASRPDRMEHLGEYQKVK